MRCRVGDTGIIITCEECERKLFRRTSDAVPGDAEGNNEQDQNNSLVGLKLIPCTSEIGSTIRIRRTLCKNVHLTRIFSSVIFCNDFQEMHQ